MRKLLSALFLVGLFAMPLKSLAFGWEYCRYSVQRTSDSWDVYIHKDWTGPGSPPVFGISIEYRVGTMSGGVITYGPWLTLPFGGGDKYVGSIGMGGGVADVQIRIPGIASPGMPPQYTIYSLPICQ